MYLTKQEEAMLRGEYGDLISRFMEILVKVGELNNAQRTVEVSSVLAGTCANIEVSGD